ncbi:MAG TPA: MFS transporter [Jatrophihabitantaceae bacterium]|jgi:MFS family permease|nr:MFS transporter [Jatrophihabitantaceae bacterium]
MRSRRSVQALLGVLAQLTQGVIGLALLLVGHEAHLSVATSALAVSAYAIGMSVGRPLQGRALDTVAPALVLAACGLAHAGAYVLITVAAHNRWAGLFVAFSMLAGLFLPPIATQMRAQWPQAVGADRATSVFAFIALLQTLSVLIAPVLFSAVSSVASAAAAMLTVAGVSGACTVLFALAVPRGRAPGGSPGRVAVRRYFTPLLLTLLVGAVAGSLEVVAPALAIAAHHPGAAGPLVIIATLGMVASGALAMRVGNRIAARTMLVRAAALEVIGAAVLLIPAPLPVAGVGLVLVCAGDTPAIAALGTLVREHAAGTAEAFGWQSTALGLGVAGGSAVAGALVTVGAHLSAVPALVCAVACAAIASFDLLAVRHQQGATA